MYILYMYLVLWNVYSEINISYLILSYHPPVLGSWWKGKLHDWQHWFTGNETIFNRSTKFTHNMIAVLSWASLKLFSPLYGYYAALISRSQLFRCKFLYKGRKLLIHLMLTLKVLVMTIDAQWEGMGDVGSARYEPALLPPCLTIRVLRYSN